MKETVQLSIGGYAFVLEKDAAEALSAYIATLESHYLSQEGGREIMDGIEERAAELLREKLGGNAVVTLSIVQQVIDIIGRPERIEADDPGAAEAGPAPRKRLYRDLENKRLGGVCAGLANYLNVDVVAFRVLFIVITIVCFLVGAEGVFSLLGVVLYGILWIAMPAARTAQERWAMKGDAGTADDIRRNVQNGIHEMGDAAREVARSDSFRTAGRWFLVFIGLALLILGSSGLASISVLSLKGMDWLGVPFNHWIEELSTEAPIFYDMLSTPWMVALVALCVILPFVAILYAGIQLIFGFKEPAWKPGLVLFVLWLIIVVVVLVILFVGAVSSDPVSLHSLLD